MFVAGVAAAVAVAGPGRAQEPLSAIDWLNDPLPTVVRRVAPSVAPGLKPMDPGHIGPEPPVTRSATVPEVSVVALDAVTANAVGLLPSSVTGLPRSLWQGSRSEVVNRQIARMDVAHAPALQSLLYTLLLAEADPPAGARTGHSVLEARLRKLIDLGAVEPAEALLDRAGDVARDLFPIWFDLALLTGDEDKACDGVMAKPHLAPDMASRIFCTARKGDWAAAAVSYDTARALGMLSAAETRMLALFIDPELAEGAPDLPPPAKITPLLYRLYEAAGTPLPTSSLPLAYAMGDLRGTSGWKAELDAAERLARTGALSENRLIELYTTRKPAASGGVWDRVAAVQRFDAALSAQDAAKMSQTLGPAWDAMKRAELAMGFVRLYAEALAKVELAGPAAGDAFEIAMLSDQAETEAAKVTATTGQRAFLAALARGVPGEVPVDDALGRAIQAGFAANVPDRVATLARQDRLGEAILWAMVRYRHGMSGDRLGLQLSLAAFRALGLEETARRAAIQMILLGQAG
ncbi:MAG: hypothetical protein CSA70_10025 [Rhodobacterales bacterium]|nr:MAG: hypothetical protein CSA70_10025 [Rhodobacterales bacterium]